MSRTEIESAISKIYATRQFDSQQDFENRLLAALQNLEFKALYVKHRELSLKKLNNNTKDLEEEYKNASKALLDYIENNNIDLKVYHKCPKCNDTGMTKDGMCDCKKALLVNMLKKESNLPKFATATFKDNKFNDIKAKQTAKMSSIYLDCQKWTANFENANKKVLFFNGNVGVGKTTLAFSIANDLLDKGYSVYYSTAFDIANMVIDKHFKRLANLDNYYNMLASDLLIIDDLGTEPQNAIAIEYLFAILDSRINDNKKTMICTNLTLEQFSKRYGERSTSRLTSKVYAYAPSFIQGDDLRKIKC